MAGAAVVGGVVVTGGSAADCAVTVVGAAVVGGGGAVVVVVGAAALSECSLGIAAARLAGLSSARIAIGVAMAVVTSVETTSAVRNRSVWAPAAMSRRKRCISPAVRTGT